MNRKAKALILTILTIVSVAPSFIGSTAFINNNKQLTSTNPIDISSLNQSFYQNLEIIANSLINSSNKIDSTTIKWKKILNAPDSNLVSDQYYAGLYSGVAGIGFLFEKLYVYTKNTTYLELAKQSANYIMSQEKFSNNSVYWSRSEFSLSSSYSSQKYGPAGISEFFLSIYNITKDIKYLHVAEQALNSLIENFIDDNIPGKSWGYIFSGSIPVSGLTYGSTGIITSFLSMYRETHNELYLNVSLKGLDWLLSLSKTNTSDIGTYRTFMYSNSPSYPYNYTGYSSGVAGIGDLFLKLYSITDDKTYLDYAKEIGNWLVLNEHNGKWLYGGVDYLTDSSNEDGYFLGLATGSTGIGLFLLNLYDITKEQTYLSSIERIHSLLYKQMKTKSDSIYFTLQTDGFFNETVHTGLKDGLAGIGLFINKYYRMFSNQSDLFLLDGINKYLTSLRTPNGFYPTEINASRTYYDSSLFEGLAGIGLFYLDTLLTISGNFERRDSILNTIGFLESIYVQSSLDTINTNSNSSVELNENPQLDFNFNIMLIVFLSLLNLIKRKSGKKN